MDGAAKHRSNYNMNVAAVRFKPVTREVNPSLYYCYTKIVGNDWLKLFKLKFVINLLQITSY